MAMSTTHSLRHAGDNLNAAVRQGRFQPKRDLSEEPGGSEDLRRAIAAAREGDSDALRYLYVRYADNVYGYVRSIVRDDHEAEDITQHVFAKLMTAVKRYEQRSVPFSAWILRVARNAAVDHVRARRATPQAEVRDPGAPYEQDPNEHLRSLREGLAQLPDDQRTVIVLRHVVGLTPAEIAAKIGKTESAVHGLHHRGRRALRAELTRLEAAPTAVALAVAH